MSLFFCPLSYGQSHDLERALKLSREINLGRDPQWLRLLHYKPAVFTRAFESQADGKEFFVAASGKSDPQAELEATLQGFFSTEVRSAIAPKLPQTTRCQFPARWRFLSQRLGLKPNSIPKQNCEKYEEWHRKINAKSVTLVFSSYYLNNPSSTFGHSLLRFNRTESAGGSERSQLLDYGINYAAVPTTQNPILYTIAGMAGFFHGEFTSLAYYYKVREYNDFESRDLWEYDLNLTPEEVEMLVEHFWELGSTYFDYYYLTENCSFHMLTALEAVSPRLDLTSHLPFWIIPSDTIKAVYNSKGLVKDIHFRPSVYTQLNYRYGLLANDDERAAFEKVIANKNTDTTALALSPESKSHVLDTALDFFDFKYGTKLLQKDEELTKWKQRILIARSHLPSATTLNIAPLDIQRPHVSHDSLRLGLGYWLSSDSNFSLEPTVRFALHDLLDPIQGYPTYAKIEFLYFRFRYDNLSKSFYLNSGLFFSIDSFSSLEHFAKPISWRLQLGAERIDDSFCPTCLPLFVRTGGGLAWNYLSSPILSQYVFLQASVHSSSQFPDSKFSLTAGPVSGLRLILNPRLIALGEIRWLTNYYSMPDFTRTGEFNIRYAPTPSWAIDIGQRWNRYFSEIGLNIYSYF